MHAKQLRIKGHVQGVFFRVSAKKEADKLGLKGWVMNDTDESVKVHIEGEEGALEDFARWCNIGPSTATVKTVDVRPAELENCTEFEVRL